MNSSNSIPREVIDDIREQSDVVEVISECGILLKPMGKEYKGLCPFHDEKTPSFTVSPARQMFYCFGCQTGGNVISFVQKHEGKSFIETVEWLASRIGMSLPNQDSQTTWAGRKRLELQDLTRLAMTYFHKQLLTPTVGGEALAYLKNRGVKDETIRSFQLGYARPGRRELVKAATHSGFSIQQLIDAGLIKNDDQGPVDRFRGRVIFPILNERNIPVGFGGRALSDDHMPKYLNSPATDLYDKSKILYNLHNSRATIQKSGTALLVEGYMDALMLHQGGVQNVVASLGTSLSESHASLLKRFAEEVTIVYDGDSAGLQATLRGLHQLLKEGLRVRIALLPAGEDPDGVIRQQGVDGFDAIIKGAMNLIEFQIQRAVEQNAIHHVDVKAQAVKEISLTLSNVISPVEVSEYVKYTAQELEIDQAALWSELRRLGVKTARPGPASRPSAASKKESASPRQTVEWQLIATLIQSPELISEVKEQLHYHDFTHPDFVEIVQMLWEARTGETSVDIQTLIDTCTDERIKGLLSSAVLSRTIPQRLKRARIDGCLKKLRHYLLWEMERTIRSTALTQGNDNVNTLQELVGLSNRRKQFGL